MRAFHWGTGIGDARFVVRFTTWDKNAAMNTEREGLELLAEQNGALPRGGGCVRPAPVGSGRRYPESTAFRQRRMLIPGRIVNYIATNCILDLCHVLLSFILIY